MKICSQNIQLNLYKLYLGFVTINLIILVLPLFCVAEWNERKPLPVQLTKATKKHHNDRGVRRMVRIKDVTLCLADGAEGNEFNEGIYRTVDNGRSWDLIGSMKGSCRGVIVSGPDEMVYVFWISLNTPSGIYLSKFKYNEKPNKPVLIHKGYVKSVGYDWGYQDSSAAVDKDGNLYFTCHFPLFEGGVDRLWLLKSVDNGLTWENIKQISFIKDTSIAYPSLEVDHNNHLVLCFAQHSPVFNGGRKDKDKRIYFIKSHDFGETWGRLTQVDASRGPFMVYNPCLIEDKQNTLYIFAQRAWNGLVMAKSNDGGATWGGFSTIIPTSNYADPSAAVGENGNLYVTYRGDNLCDDTKPKKWRNCMASSKDQGETWIILDTYCDEGRVGPAGAIRFANWWNYGGPLEWCWEQWLKKDKSNRPVYYNINTGIRIWDRLENSKKDKFWGGHDSRKIN